MQLTILAGLQPSQGSTARPQAVGAFYSLHSLAAGAEEEVTMRVPAAGKWPCQTRCADRKWVVPNVALPKHGSLYEWNWNTDPPLLRPAEHGHACVLDVLRIRPGCQRGGSRQSVNPSIAKALQDQSCSRGALAPGQSGADFPQHRESRPGLWWQLRRGRIARREEDRWVLQFGERLLGLAGRCPILWLRRFRDC